MIRRELDLPHLDGVLREVKHLQAGGYQRVGDWDLSQTCQHLGALIAQSVDGFNFKLPWYVRLLGPWLIKRSLFKTRSIRPGLTAPAPLQPAPDSGQDETAAIADLAEQIKRFIAADTLHPSPVLGRLEPDEWHQFHAIHASHHLSFLLPLGA